MIRYLFSSELSDHPDLAAAMFRDRTTQFRDRMGWDVQVDDMGWETDAYDGMDPLYVIAEDGRGGHSGSMRFLPTTAPHMISDVFSHLLDGHAIRSPKIWECTRFCLAPGAGNGVARTLLLGASALGLGMDLTHAVGVFDAPMLRVYRRLGWAPEILGGDGGVSVGSWAFSAETHDALCRGCGVPARTPRRWFEAAFGDLPLSAPLPTCA